MNRIIFFVFCLLSGLSVGAQELKLGAIFTDNMVLQQQTQAPIWGWAKPNTQVHVTPSWDHQDYQVTSDGQGKWRLKIQTPKAGGPFELSVSDGTPLVLHNILIGEVWLCSGQSNMEMPLRGFKSQPVIGSNETIIHSKNPLLRIYTVPRSSQLAVQEDSKPSAWKESAPETVAKFSATAYYFGSLLQELLGIPVGLIHSSYGGSTVEAWMDQESLKDFPEIKLPTEIKEVSRTPTTLYHGMIHPIVGYAIKGCIWYQGESNYERPDQYEQLFPAMVKRWRTLWGQGDFPFYYAQIAPYNYAQLPPYRMGGKYNSAYLRDAQRKSQGTIPNSSMAVLMDIGEEASIHPAHKKPGGERLALLALTKTYGRSGFGYASPEYESMVVEDGHVTIRFKEAGNGLTSFGEPLSLFEVAGEDQVFHPAQAAIVGSTVVVSSTQVKKPVAVRYAFKDFVVGDLFSTEGLPVSSFRTDNW